LNAANSGEVRSAYRYGAFAAGLRLAQHRPQGIGGVVSRAPGAGCSRVQIGQVTGTPRDTQRG